MTGLFIAIDGPGGVGKTTTAAAVAAELRCRGQRVHVTAEPSAGPIGTLARAVVNEVTGHALACLVAADRYHHLDAEIRPRLAAGHIVVCDRYLASTLVLQVRDGLPQSWLLALNAHIDLPGLAVILTAAPLVIAARLDHRGRHDRFEGDPALPGAEDVLYRTAADILASRGVPVIRVDTSVLPADEVAARIADAAAKCCASLQGHG
ncbi:MAG TPA: dTMP kinase [Streptosporangiaceae bacterium]